MDSVDDRFDLAPITVSGVLNSPRGRRAGAGVARPPPGFAAIRLKDAPTARKGPGPLAAIRTPVSPSPRRWVASMRSPTGAQVRPNILLAKRIIATTIGEPAIPVPPAGGTGQSAEHHPTDRDHQWADDDEEEQQAEHHPGEQVAPAGRGAPILLVAPSQASRTCSRRRKRSARTRGAEGPALASFAGS